jgi:hypothetical protein
MVNVLVILDGASEALGVIRVCPDHGWDPATGQHVAGPVPCVTSSPATMRS